jgi:RPA family protein
MTPIEIAKMGAKIMVALVVGSFTTKAVIANAPATRKMHVAEGAGMLTGAVAAVKLEPKTDQFVENIFAKLEENKKKR